MLSSLVTPEKRIKQNTIQFLMKNSNIRNRKVWIFCVFLLLFFPCFFSHAEILNHQRSIKALGMGEAYMSVVQDSEAFFYNPASIARFNRMRWTLINAHLGVNYFSFNDITDFFQLEKEENFVKILRNFYGKPLWAETGARVSFELPFVMAIVSNDLSAHLFPRNPVFPSLDLHLYNDLVFGGGLALPLISMIDVGVVLKYIDRSQVKEKITTDSLLSLDWEHINETTLKRGTALLFDVGLNVTPDIFLEPVTSVIWKNPTKTKFKAYGDSSYLSPDSDSSELSAGFAFTLKDDVISYTPAFEFKHILKKDISWTKKVHIGLQIKASPLLVSGGFSQGYYSFGAGLQFLENFLEIYGAFYQIELGDYAGQIVERRVALNVKISFETGEAFSKGGRKSLKSLFEVSKDVWRRLKKRR